MAFLFLHRRLDEWVTLDKFQLETLQPRCMEDSDDRSSLRRRSSASTTVANRNECSGPGEDPDRRTTMDNQGNNNNKSPFSMTGGNWHRSNSGDPATTAFEQEHEETTKVKNIEKIVMGGWEVAAWYYSPFPAEYSDVETLYVCEFCLSYMKKKKTLIKHKTECPCREPPGKRIYQDEDLAVYELDGKENLAYCQKLCLLAKLFLDHKTLYYDVTPFYFYVITKVDVHGAHIVGYFSKEKVRLHKKPCHVAGPLTRYFV
jgi:histone acetyltransferase MYST1